MKRKTGWTAGSAIVVTRDDFTTVMGKRSTNTEKWKTRWMRSLPGAYKLLWLYVQDVCDVAGTWEVDMETACLQVGMAVTEQEALSWFGERVLVCDGGLRWWLVDFIEEQWGGLHEKSNIYKPICKILQEYELGPFSKGLASPLEGATKGVEEAPCKGVIINNIISNNEDNTSKNITKNDDDVLTPSDGLTRGLQGASVEILRQAQDDKVKWTAASLLAPKDAKGVYLVSGVCAESRELALLYVKTNGGKGVVEELDGWCDAFNRMLAAKMVTGKPLGDYASHFLNWLRLNFDKKVNPENLNNGTGKQNTNTGGGNGKGGNGGGRATAAATLQPGDSFYTTKR